MVVKEKALLRAMKDAYKGAGYKVALECSSGIENILLAAPGWVVVVEKANMPRKALGLIVEHLGTIPEPGEAYQASKDQTQTEIFDMAMSRLLSIRSGEKKRFLTAKTQLTLMGNSVWQREGDHNVVMVDPTWESIMDTYGRKVTMIEDEMLMVDGNVSRCYIECDSGKWSDEAEALDHLAKLQWVSV